MHAIPDHSAALSTLFLGVLLVSDYEHDWRLR